MKKKVHKSEAQSGDYDFSQGTRGKYARRYARGTNVVILQPDVAKAFPMSKAVNLISAKDHPAANTTLAK
jgi:hypothetical protein